MEAMDEVLQPKLDLFYSEMCHSVSATAIIGSFSARIFSPEKKTREIKEAVESRTSVAVCDLL